MPEFGLMTPRDEVFPELSPQVTAALADRLITFDTHAHSAPSTVSSSRHHWLQTWLTAAAVLLLSVLGAGWWIIGSASPAQAWSAVPSTSPRSRPPPRSAPANVVGQVRALPARSKGGAAACTCCSPIRRSAFF